MPDTGDARPDDEREPEVLPADGPVPARAGAARADATRSGRAGPGAQLAVRRSGAVPQIREQLARLARNPVAVTTALVGAGLAVRLAPAALGRELAGPPAVRPPVEPAVVRHVVHHVVHVVVHVRPSPPPGVL